MKNTLLITFGCSWTYGVGVCYEKNMNSLKFHDSAWDENICSEYSFRGLLSKKYHLTNLNFSSGGSSNQRQFRLAKQFFFSNEYYEIKQQYKKIIVLWGITSTGRNELYSIESKDYINFFYNNPFQKTKNWPFPLDFLKYSYDHDIAVKEITYEMQLWNSFFIQQNIKNLWFDTFNHHNYVNYIENLIFHDESNRDLLSKLNEKNENKSYDSVYHNSIWIKDSDRISFLKSCEIVNPWTLHPTKLGHEQIAEIIEPELIKLINE